MLSIVKQIRLTGVVQSSTDVYALGVLALELIYEQYPVTSDGNGSSNRYSYIFVFERHFSILIDQFSIFCDTILIFLF